MIAHQFQPGFRTDLHRKDLTIALTAARENAVPVPVTSVVSQLFEALAAAGRGDLDHSALITIFESLAQYEIGSGN
jgi:2-hydroxy-3-oxopropionate reductase